MLSFKVIQRETAEAPAKIKLAKRVKEDRERKERANKIRGAEKTAKTLAEKLLPKLEKEIVDTSKRGYSEIVFVATSYKETRYPSENFRKPADEDISSGMLTAKYLVEMLDKNFSTKITVEDHSRTEYPDEGGIYCVDTTSVYITVSWK